MLDVQREWDMTMLNEVDADLATATSVGDEQPNYEVIRHIQVTSDRV